MGAQQAEDLRRDGMVEGSRVPSPLQTATDPVAVEGVVAVTRSSQVVGGLQERCGAGHALQASRTSLEQACELLRVGGR